jgi:type VI secretion system protein ImpG
MSDTLLTYYNRELNAIRALAADFARANPKIAGRLRLNEGTVDDPHVARLLEGAAFLAARVHQRLDDEFPELTDALLGVLYPHYLAPVPAAAIVQLTGQATTKVATRVPKGKEMDSGRGRSDACRFRTTSAVTLWPVEIDTVRLSGRPLPAPPNRIATDAQAVLRIKLRCADAKMDFTTLGVDRLRFYIRAPGNVALPLYELLCNNTVSVALADSLEDARPVCLPAQVLAPAGFGSDDAMLPWPARSFSGFRLLTEYFTLPEKFLFFDIDQLDAKTRNGAGNALEIFLYLGRAAPELERSLDKNSLALGCTPIINLFTQTCEPVSFTHTSTDYRIEPDVRRAGALEVWQVEKVLETTGDGSFREWLPFYRLDNPGAAGAKLGGSYTILRRASSKPPGNDTFLAPFVSSFDVNTEANSVFSIDALCINRDISSHLQSTGGRLALGFVGGMAPVSGISCLTAPTACLPASLRADRFWPLVSHLSLGHLSIVGGDAAAEALREVLRLYDLRGADETRAAIDALLTVTAKPSIARIPGARHGAFCRGLNITLEWDAKAWQSGGLYLLASVLERFLALHVTVNSFVRTCCVLRGEPGVVAAWPARAGTQRLL